MELEGLGGIESLSKHFRKQSPLSMKSLSKSGF